MYEWREKLKSLLFKVSLSCVSNKENVTGNSGVKRKNRREK